MIPSVWPSRPLLPLVVLLSACPQLVAAQALLDNLIEHRSHDPLTSLFGLPAAATRQATVHELRLDLTHNNVFMGGTRGRETLLLDGETTQLALRYQRRFGRCWQGGVQSTFIAHAAGRFDRAIDDWHQWFGLPDGQRDSVAFHELNYRYSRDGVVQRDVHQALQGVGDTQISLQRLIGCAPESPLLRVGIKLPTGDAASFLGSGATDLFFDVLSPDVAFDRWSLAGSIGALQVGEVDDLALSRSVVAFGVFGTRYRWSDRLVLLAQLDWHSALFDSDLRELGALSGQGSLGLRYRLNSGTVDLSFAEDVVVDTAPDIAVRLSYSVGY